MGGLGRIIVRENTREIVVNVFMGTELITIGYLSTHGTDRLIDIRGT